MKLVIAFAVLVSFGFAGAGALAACPPSEHPKKTHATKPQPPPGGCVDLNAVPQISATIVAREPAPTATKSAAAFDPGTAQYEGPTLGLTKPNPGVFPTPTVGYKWSLE